MEAQRRGANHNRITLQQVQPFLECRTQPRHRLVLLWQLSLTQRSNETEADYGSTLGQEMGFPHGSAANNPPADGGNLGSSPGSGRSPGEGNLHFGIFAWDVPWTEEPGRLQAMRSVKESVVTTITRRWRKYIWFPPTALRPVSTATWSRGATHLCLHGLAGPQSRWSQAEKKCDNPGQQWAWVNTCESSSSNAVKSKLSL